MDEVNISKAYINSKSANKLEVQENEIVNLKSNNGQIRVEIIIDDSISDYVVMMYVGWWEGMEILIILLIVVYLI